MSVFVDDIQSSAWGEPIASWTYSSGVAVVDFTDLSGYRDLLLWYDALTHASGGTTYFGVQTSTDNGATFAASGYTGAGVAVATRFVLSSTVAAATPIMGVANMIDLNTAADRTKFWVSGGLEGSSTVFSRTGVRTAELNNAIRIGPQDGSNFSAGRMVLYGRRG